MTRAIGCDVSHWDGDVNFEKMRSSGASFVFIKASQNSKDVKFDQNWKNAKKAGLLRGAYHYLDWGRNPIDQANLFSNTLLNDVGELPPVCDVEDFPNGLSKTDIERSLKSFIELVEKKTEKIPMIYCGYYYWRDNFPVSTSWIKYPFWLAWYTTVESSIRVPAPWTKWNFWQYTDKGSSKTYGSQKSFIDLNYFSGSESELQDWANHVIVPIPVPVDTCKYITIGNVNLRNEPALEGSSIIGTILKGTEVTVDKSEGYYSHIIYPNIGWVYSAFLKPVEIREFIICPTCNGTGKVLK